MRIGCRDVNKIRDGICDKFAGALQYFGAFITGITIGFVKGWKLTLVILSLAPIMIISAFFFAKVRTSFFLNSMGRFVYFRHFRKKIIGSSTEVELKFYAKAGAIAQEVFTSIRTVFAYNGAQKEHKR